MREIYIFFISKAVYKHKLGEVGNESIILPRNAMRKRGHCCRPVSVRLYVRPSVTLMYCILTAEDIVKFLSRPGSPIILVF